jgi:hypothetical protein
MNVTVKLQGAKGRLGRRPENGAVEFDLPGGATAGDLLGRLADRFGEPFSANGNGGPPRPGAWLPGGVRMFVGGQMARDPAQPLAAPGAESQKVIVILVSPMMGGA